MMEHKAGYFLWLIYLNCADCVPTLHTFQADFTASKAYDYDRSLNYYEANSSGAVGGMGYGASSYEQNLQKLWMFYLVNRLSLTDFSMSE